MTTTTAHIGSPVQANTGESCTGAARPCKVIIFPLGWLLGHVTRCLAIGKALEARGHEVVFAGEDPASAPDSELDLVRQAGFRLIPAPEPDLPYAWRRFLKYGWLASAWDLIHNKHWAPLEDIIEAHVAILRAEQPDLAVGDATISVSTAAYITGIPSAGIMNGYCARFTSATSPFNALIHGYDGLFLAHIRRQVYKRHGVPPINAIKLLRSNPMISPDLEGLYAPPKNHPQWHMAGPVLTEVNVPLPDWYDELDDGQTNVYISMGSTGMFETFLRRTLDTLATLPYRFVMTTGGQVSQEILERLPANFRVAQYAPGRRILERCQALIFHGGNGTMYQALAAGVPMIAVPSHVEQRYNIQPGVEHGFAKVLPARRIKGKAIANALHTVLSDPAYRQAAERFAPIVQRADGAARAAEILEQTALSRRTS